MMIEKGINERSKGQIGRPNPYERSRPADIKREAKAESWATKLGITDQQPSDPRSLSPCAQKDPIFIASLADETNESATRKWKGGDMGRSNSGKVKRSDGERRARRVHQRMMPANEQGAAAVEAVMALRCSAMNALSPILKYSLILMK